MAGQLGAGDRPHGVRLVHLRSGLLSGLPVDALGLTEPDMARQGGEHGGRQDLTPTLAV